MTHPDHERHESELKALFDATADEASGAQLTKLRARAADVPARGRRPRWLAWAPVFAVAAGALAVFVARGGREEGPVARSSATVQAPAPTLVASAPAPAPSEPVAEDPPQAAEDNGAVADLGYGDEGFGIDELSGPLDEADEEELDGWLAATDSFLEDG